MIVSVAVPPVIVLMPAANALEPTRSELALPLIVSASTVPAAIRLKAESVADAPPLMKMVSDPAPSQILHSFNSRLCVIKF